MSCVVRGSAIIGARARICDAYVRPSTSIGDEVLVEGAEIEHSVLLAGASTGIWDAAWSERDRPEITRIAGFSPAAALRLTVGEGTEVCLT